MQIKTNTAASEIIENLMQLKESAGWKIIKNQLEEWRKEAHNNLLSSEISAKPEFNSAEITRREHNYLETIIGMPENLIDGFKKGQNEGENSDDPNEEQLFSEPEDIDDPQSLPVGSSAPDAPLI